MKATKLLVAFVLVATLLRCWLVFFEAVSPQEAYYFLCAERPAEAYFDGPSGTAALIRATGPSWRFLAPFWALAATLACFVLCRRLGDEELAAWTAMAMNALPIFNSAALRVGPELPALTFALLALACFRKAYDAEKRTLLWWLAAGLFSGLGVWFSYAVALVFVAMAAIALSSPKHRNARDFFGLGMVLVIIAGVSVPALAWNARQDWIPIAGGTFRTLWEFDALGFLRVVGRSLMQFSPVLALVLVTAWGGAAGEARRHLRARFVFAGTLPWILLGFYFLLRGEDVSLLFLLAAPLMLFYALNAVGIFRTITLWAIAIAVIFSGMAMVSTVQEGKSWRAVARTLQQIEGEKTQGVTDGLFFIAENEDLAAILGYYLRLHFMPPAGHPTVYVKESQAMSGQFALWPSYDDFVESPRMADEYFTEQKGENPFMGRSALYIGREAVNDLPQSIRGAFQSVQEISKVTIPRSPASAEPLYIYLCLNYQTLPL